MFVLGISATLCFLCLIRFLLIKLMSSMKDFVLCSFRLPSLCFPSFFSSLFMCSCFPLLLYPTMKIHKWPNNRFYQHKYLVCTWTERKYAVFHSLLSIMVEANYRFCQKSITLQDDHLTQSKSKNLASTPLRLPMPLNDFFS